MHRKLLLVDFLSVCDTLCQEFFIPKCKGDCSNQGQYKMTFSLQDMLEQSCSSDDEAKISEEEILKFKANEKKLLRKRQELRETLRKRFLDMQQQQQGQPNDGLTQHMCNMWL